jgi:class 3 adenylate cyclase
LSEDPGWLSKVASRIKRVGSLLMPLYMDRHNVPGATPQDVAAAHLRDLGVAGKYDVEFFSYWFDAAGGSVFCFARAPSATAVEQVHSESHGLIPSEVIEVAEGEVVRFLGKVSDPVDASQITSPLRTIVFTDLSDSTALMEEVGEPRFMRLLTEHDSVIRRALLQWTGREVKHTGDGFLISFSEAHNALSWSLHVRDAFSEGPLLEGYPPLRIRIGMAAGEPVDHDNDLFGATVHRASRICGLAEPGHVLVMEMVRDLAAGSDFVFGEARRVPLKGFSEEASVCELLGGSDQ